MVHETNKIHIAGGKKASVDRYVSEKKTGKVYGLFLKKNVKTY